jgi:hypothetical protein
MFEKVIEFSAHEDYFALKEDYPTPIKLNIPEWYKKLDFSFKNKTVKGCMPFLDTLTSGYLLKMPQDFNIDHNIENKEGFKDSFSTVGLHAHTPLLYARGINLNSAVELHPVKQLEGSPLVEKNKNLPFYKIINPWKIKTPEGYSCLFVPPLNNADDRFSIIPGIVDTDTFNSEINFPFVINGDKYPILKTTFEKGLPYVQIIPFKRDSWKMTLKSSEHTEIQRHKISYNLKLLAHYKNKFWSKKSWR